MQHNLKPLAGAVLPRPSAAILAPSRPRTEPAQHRPEPSTGPAFSEAMLTALCLGALASQMRGDR